MGGLLWCALKLLLSLERNLLWLLLNWLGNLLDWSWDWVDNCSSSWLGSEWLSHISIEQGQPGKGYTSVPLKLCMTSISDLVMGYAIVVAVDKELPKLIETLSLKFWASFLSIPSQNPWRAYVYSYASKKLESFLPQSCSDCMEQLGRGTCSLRLCFPMKSTLGTHILTLD